ncbi:MAG: FISUMP domain-containing protein [Bacteroidales bacterium]|nr:FISUMP domain-containing protein [Bacteroidales bacterium]
MKKRCSINFSLITLSMILAVLVAACRPEPNTKPIADFSMTPTQGTTQTVFTFDASTSSDLEDPIDALEVRWDWESDSIFDTEYSTTKIIQHQFEQGATYYVTVEVRDTKGSTARYTDYVKVNWLNRPPTASFVVTPSSGFLQDVFQFNASACSDAEDQNATLRVRWDLDGDGTWDTEYSTEKLVSHQYSTPGTYTVKLEVIDSGNATNEATYTLEVGELNSAPEPPTTPDPADQKVDQSTLCTLKWTCIDPDADQLMFDVYFGTSANPPRVKENTLDYQYVCSALEYGTTYYWKVVAKDPYDHVVSSPIWSFTTDLPEYQMGTFVDRRNNRTYKTVNINGQIWMAENLDIGTMIHGSTGGDDRNGYMRNNNIIEKYCYQNDPANCELYGGLYQWDEAMGYSKQEAVTGICPEGWHLPNNAEWIQLAQALDPVNGESMAGDKLILGSRSGFQALFAGYFIFAERNYFDLGQAAYFWTSTINEEFNHLSILRSIYRENPHLQRDTGRQYNGLPVRCIKNY